jgi:hypothetical protein
MWIFVQRFCIKRESILAKYGFQIGKSFLMERIEGILARFQILTTVEGTIFINNQQTETGLWYLQNRSGFIVLMG